MHPAIGSILRSSTRRSDEKFNIITFSTHERYQSNMSDVYANFWTINNPKIKSWNTNFADVPLNHILLDNVYNITDIPAYIQYDAILSQSKFNQFPLAKKISDYFNIPIISLEHTQMINNRVNLKHMKGDVNVFISEYSVKSWEVDYDCYVIEHGINNRIFHNKNIKRENKILSVVNDWINRDFECGYHLWKEITKDLPVFVAGDTPNLSRAAKNTDELVNIYNRHSIFLNTSIYSPIPTTLLEAMSCGCCVISTENEMINKVIENGKNGFVSNDKSELRKYLEICLKNEDMCKDMGKKARQTIIEKFSISDFTENWNTILKESLEK
jgi:glycosyltransferase involved in cell wall biosynthesis